MDIWEYYSLVITWRTEEGWKGQGSNGKNIAGQTMADLLDQMGQGGWELVSITPSRYFRTNWINYTINSGQSGSSATEWMASEYRAFFKRKKP